MIEFPEKKYSLCFYISIFSFLFFKTFVKLGNTMYIILGLSILKNSTKF